MTLFTFADAFDALIAYLGASPSTQTLRDCRQAIDEALRDIVNAHTWSYYYTFGRLNTNAPFNDGTIKFQLSSGPLPNYMTLTPQASTGWPSWAADGYIYINNIVYRVDRVIDATHLTMQVLNVNLAPRADLAAGTSYQLYQDSYLLPVDFIAQDQSLYETCFGPLQYVHPREWLFAHRYIFNTGIPQFYAIDSDIKYPNRLVVRLAPLPVDNRTLDYIYKRRPRPILWQTMSQGTVSLVSGSVSVVGVGTAFDQTMAGSVLRVSPTVALPTWMPGPNPATFEAIIDSVQDSTHLKLMPLTPSTVTYTGVGYVISDPIDIETGSMLNAFLRCCEHKVGQIRIMKDKPDALTQYRYELQKAKDADTRSFSGRAEGEIGWNRMRLKDMPLGPDMS